MGVKASDIPFGQKDGVPEVTERVFTDLGDQRYAMRFLPAGILFEVERLRRSSSELWGELCVKIPPTGFLLARTYDDILSIGDLNFSSVNARKTRADILEKRSRAEHLDWFGFVEEFSTKLIASERYGASDINLQTIVKPPPDRMYHIDGVDIPLKHPMILFGDGGTAKSYLAMYWAGTLVKSGHNVLYADWEFTPEEHRERLECLFGVDFPAVRYLSCHRSFKDERERLHRIILQRSITYLICDSVGLACGGDPSTAEAATAYFQALRTLGEIGSLHIAHVTKSGIKGEDGKPFGSAFWHNMARITLNIKAEPIGDSSVALALYPRKNNLRQRSKPTGYTVHFGDLMTTINPSNIKDFAALEEGLPLPERIMDAVRYNSKTRKELADILDADYPTLQRAVHRGIKRGELIEIESSMKGKQRIALSGSKTTTGSGGE